MGGEEEGRGKRGKKEGRKGKKRERERRKKEILLDIDLGEILRKPDFCPLVRLPQSQGSLGFTWEQPSPWV